MSTCRGTTLAEAVGGLALLGLLALAGLSAAAAVGDEVRTAAAARNWATRFAALRWRSVAAGRSHGILFERDAAGWTWREVRDGNGNGLRTAEVRRGVDPTLSAPQRAADGPGRIRFGFPGDGPFPRIPPGRGRIRDLDDPVQFGRSNLVSFGILGGASSGTLYLTDGGTTLYAVVLYGASARARVWRWNAKERRWTL